MSKLFVRNNFSIIGFATFKKKYITCGTLVLVEMQAKHCSLNGVCTC